MDANGHWRHRGSLQTDPYNVYNSTPQSGSNGRAASLGQTQFQNNSYQTHVAIGQAQQPFLNSPPYTQHGLWSNETYPPQQLDQPEVAATNEIDPAVLRQLSTRADEEPWSGEGAANRSMPGWHQIPPFQLYPPLIQGPRAHTTTGGARSPTFQHPQTFAARPPVPSDSGFGSGNGGSQDLPRQTRDFFEFTSGPRSAFVPGAPPPPPSGSVKSDSRVQTSQESNRRGNSKLPVRPCPTCGKKVKNQSDAR